MCYIEIICPGILSLRLCPGDYVQEIMSKGLCPGDYVHGIMSRRLCPGNYVRRLCPRDYVIPSDDIDLALLDKLIDIC